MPIYEYECTSCGHRFEIKQRFSDEPVASCPECGNLVRRLLYPAGIIFKGSGFYITDYKRNNSSNGKSETKSETTSSASKND
ncbi:zinc ribbon domain-containing protein [Thermomicrobium sp. CFH 73360]|uniref:FmdB family zinc ribbon protein n=1 Tax=Thermomicrobium sp. CFH 73360 TaxID=2951987 RepID=UPI002076F7C9|nr:FmdB family zinc ribbon protein [Thermomicrobium sp. CFH 73360]MCM8746611.1 zinc ribbon domain-containing protein [Thermomicrobium sp. CFH 73360]